MSDEYYLPCTAELLAEIASIRCYSEEQEVARAERTAANTTAQPQPTSAEIVEAIQKLTDEIAQLRIAIGRAVESVALVKGDRSETPSCSS